MRRNWSNFPFAPARLPFFYGWVLLGAATLGMLSSIPGQTMGVGIFTDFLLDVLYLDRSQLSLAYALGTIGSALLLPLAGSWVDRLGIRITGAASALGLALSLVMLAKVRELAALVPFPDPVGPFAAIFLCFMCLRFFGQGCITMIARVGVGKWFDKRRGRAVALMGVFTAFTFNASPAFLNYLVRTWEWYGAALILAGIVGLGMTLVSLLFYRDSPESCGLRMDGAAVPVPGSSEDVTPEPIREFTRGEAARTMVFWAYSLGPATQGMVMTAITFHMASLGTEFGLDRDTAYALFFPMAFFSVTSNMVGGWLSDRIDLKWILGFMMVMQAVGIVGLASLDTPVGRWLFIVGHGCSGGLFSTMTTVPLPRFFGRAHLGAISGFNMSVMVFASAVGPFLFSAGFDYFGSYRAVTLACLVMPVAVAVLGWVAKDPRRTSSD